MDKFLSTYDEDFDINQVKGFVYKIVCNETNKVYVGQTLSHVITASGVWKERGMYGRLFDHFNRAICGMKYPLYIDIRKYGINSFTIKVIHTVNGNEITLLDSLEETYISKYNCMVPLGYNQKLKDGQYSITKKKLIEYYGLVVERNIEYNQRMNRRCQQTKGKLDIILEDIERIDIVPINHGNEISEIRVLVYMLNRKDIVRKSFHSKDVNKSINEAEKYAFSLTNNVILDPRIKDIKNGKDGNKTYKYQKKLECILNTQDILRVYGNFQYHKVHDNYTYLLLFYPKGSKSIRCMFGGKTQNAVESYKSAREFVDKFISKYEKTIKIDLKEPTELFGPQQVAASNEDKQ